MCSRGGRNVLIAWGTGSGKNRRRKLTPSECTRVRRGAADTRGMVTVETIAKIRRDHFKDGKSIKAIARTRGLSRNTVRKVLRSEETAFRYDRQAPTVYPKLGAFQAQLEEFLTVRLGQPRRERLTLMRMCELLREAGYTGGYDAVRRYARWWRRAHG